MASSMRPAASLSWAESATLASIATLSMSKMSKILEARVII
jgi:hypothetical protein